MTVMLDQAEARVREAETLLWPALVAGMPDPLFVLDGEGRFVMLSAAWRTLTGLDVADTLDRYLLPLVHQDDRPEVQHQLHGVLSGLTSVWRGSFRLATRRQGDVWVEVHAAPQRSSGGGVDHVVGVLRDMTFAKQRELGFQRLSLHDEVAGVPNRTLLLDRLERRHARSRRHKQPLFALAFVDLDTFKAINDTYGHMLGDGALRAAAGRLVGAVRATDTVARFGGDEFAVLLDEVGGADDALMLATHMCQAVSEPLTLDGLELKVTCSVGVVVSDVPYVDVPELLDFADQAMYEAKVRGNGAVLYRAAAHRPGRLFNWPWPERSEPDGLGGARDMQRREPADGRGGERATTVARARGETVVPLGPYHASTKEDPRS